MRYSVLASDYDGTLADEGVVRRDVVEALLRTRRSGRKLVLVTGRELEDLMRWFPHLELFDCVVAENGALLYTPNPPIERPLAAPPPASFLAALRARGVDPLVAGRIIVATELPNEQAVLAVIREQGLELEVIFNKRSVMILPSGTNKATGLASALADLGVPPESVVAVGDGENDHSLLAQSGLGVAVANAVPALRQHADFVTTGAAGQGVIEVINRLVTDDLAGVERGHQSVLEPVL